MCARVTDLASAIRSHLPVSWGQREIAAVFSQEHVSLCMVRDPKVLAA